MSIQASLVLSAVLLSGCTTGLRTAVPIEGRTTSSPSTVTAKAENKISNPVASPSPDTVNSPRVYAIPDRAPVPLAPLPAPIPSPIGGERDGTVSSAKSPVTDLMASADQAARKGDRGRARATLERAVKIAPDDAQVWYQLAELNLAEGDYEQAIVVAQRSITLARSEQTLIARNRSLIQRAQHLIALKH
ncbi:MAG: tetratricopeptide repeat protein [Gammaproteobacteria bacterium]|nr:tetratricopeptide repeat protein [Gammaproteobacteria bacterium]